MSNLYNEMIEFAKDNIAPFTTQVDAEAKFPVDSFKAIKDKKLTGLLVPKEFGGMGFGFYEHTQTVLALLGLHNKINNEEKIKEIFLVMMNIL